MLDNAGKCLKEQDNVGQCRTTQAKGQRRKMQDNTDNGGQCRTLRDSAEQCAWSQVFLLSVAPYMENL
jgi:hypothetical protein